MAESHVIADETYDNDYAAHEHDYLSFLKVLKMSTIGVIILLILIAWIWL